MAEVTYTVTGTREVAQTLEKFEKSVKDAGAINREIGSIIVSEASALAPFRTGNLAKSIRYESGDDKIVIYAGDETVKYAPIIEYGWQAGNREGKRFISRTLSKNMEVIVEKYDDLVKDSIKKYNLD